MWNKKFDISELCKKSNKIWKGKKITSPFWICSYNVALVDALWVCINFPTVKNPIIVTEMHPHARPNQAFLSGLLLKWSNCDCSGKPNWNILTTRFCWISKYYF